MRKQCRRSPDGRDPADFQALDSGPGSMSSKGHNKFVIRTAVYLSLLLAASVAADVRIEAVGEISPRNAQFSHLTTADGLSQPNVYDIEQDHRRYIWIATQEGLNRYDGYQFKLYEHIRGKPETLSHDFVRTLLVDAEGTVWVGTERGLNRYDPLTDSFRREPFAGVVGNALPSVPVRSMLQTKRGNYWVGTQGEGLFRIDPRSGQLQRFGDDETATGRLPDDTVLSLLEDRKGNLWVGTERAGLFRFDSVTGQFLRQGSADGDDSGYLGAEIRKIYEDSNGFIWIGTGSNGVGRFDPRHGNFQRFTHSHDSPGNLDSLKIRDIVQDHRGTLWLATDAGLVEWRESEKGFTTYQHDEGNEHSLIGDRLNTLFVDASGVLWVGSWDGISRWNYFSDTFTYYHEANDLLPGDVVTSMADGHDRSLWVGTYGAGLARIDLAQMKTLTFRHDPDDPNSLPDDRVMTVHRDSRNQIWVGTRSGGLARFDEESGDFVRYRHDPADAASISGDAVSSIYSDSQGRLWVGTYGAGLNMMEDAGRFQRFRHDPNDPLSLSGDRVVLVTADQAERIWIGTDGKGLNRLDSETGTFRRFDRYAAPAAEAASMDEYMLETVTDLIQDRRGQFWIGTLGNGLLQARSFDDESGVVEASALSKANGLPTDTIYGVLHGQDDDLWLSSNRGLIRIDARNRTVRQFDRNNGLREDEFNVGARLRSRDGRLLFGSAGGLVAFFPGELPVNSIEPGVVLVARSRSEELAVTSSGEALPEIDITYIDRFLSFDFVGLDFMSPDKNQYRYILEGFDEDWVEADEIRRATYTNLPAGNYSFKVQASNNDGVWNREGAAIKVTVIPAPWDTWWAYLGYASVLIIAVGLYLRSQRQKLRYESHQRVMLEQEVSERTRELAQRNWQLEKLNDKLAEASVTDALTGLRNRRYVDQFINSEVSLFERSQAEDNVRSDQGGNRKTARTMFFMMIDLDGFKLINDRYGHHAGDAALVQVKDILRDSTRISDTLIRWGGDEFMVIGFASGFYGVKILAERIRESIAEHRYDVGGGKYGRLSASIGITPYPLVEEQESLCNWELVATLADHAAYIAKANGRNAWVSLSGTERLEASMLDGISTRLTAYIDDGVIEMGSSLEEAFVTIDREAADLRRSGVG
jgi:diguanylate cyclase (GGDEF)-like protein